MKGGKVETIGECVPCVSGVNTMLRHSAMLFILCTVLSAGEPLVAFYRTALETLGTGKMAALESRRGDLAVSGAETDRFATLSADLLYTHTNADLLKQPFQTTDIALGDTIDLFGKRRDSIEALRLESQGNLQLLDLQKQQLFTALADLVVAYRKAEALFRLHARFYRQQNSVLEHLRSGAKAGAFPRMDADRFADALSALEVQIAEERSSIDTMKAQLALYAPGQPIPAPEDQNVSADEARFVLHAPQLRYTALHAGALAAQASGIAKQWRPELVAGMAYQFNNDPTANGDNYAFNAGLHMGFGGGIGKRAEAARVAALQANLEATRQRVEVRQRYLALRSNYESAEQSLSILENAVRNAGKNAETMQKAYLKHYVDFNTYLQTVQQQLSLEVQRIDARYRAIRSALLLNVLSRGEIYD